MKMGWQVSRGGQQVEGGWHILTSACRNPCLRLVFPRLDSTRLRLEESRLRLDSDL